MNRTGKIRLIAITMAFVSSGCEEGGPTSPDRHQPAEAASLETLPYEQIGGGMIAFQRVDDIYIVDLDARTASVIRSNGWIAGAAIAPDRSRLAYSRSTDFETSWDIYTLSLDGTGETQVTSFRNQERWPTWSPDGNSLVAHTSEGSGNSVHLIGIRPPAPPAPLWYVPDSFFPGPSGRISRSADGALVFTSSGTGSLYRYARYIVDTLYTAPEQNRIHAPAFSPDDGRIAFLEDDAADRRIRVQVVDGDGGELRTVADLPRGSHFRAGLFGIDMSLCWLDEERIVFVKPHKTSTEEEYSSLYMVRADGTGLVRITTREVTTDSVSCAR